MYALLIKLWKHLERKRKTQFFLILFLMFLASVAEIMSIGAVVPFLGIITNPDQVFLNPNFKGIISFFGIDEPNQLILPFTIFFVLSAVISGLIRLVLIYCTTRLSYGTGHDISTEIYKKTLYQDYVVHISRNSSEVINGIVVKSSTVISGVLTPALTFISSIIIIFGISSVLLFVNFFVASITFVCFGVLYLSVILIWRFKIKSNSQVISSETDSVMKTLNEGLMGIRDVILNNSQEFHSNIYKKTNYSLRLALGNNLFLSGSPRFVMESIGMVLIALIAFYLTQNNQISESIPVLGALALGAQRLLPMMQQGYASFTTIRGSLASLEDIIELLDQKVSENVTLPLEPISFKKEIIFNEVGFKYSKEEPWIFEGLNLNIRKGSKIGIIGTTGSGKTTLIDLFMGLIVPTKGFISVDDKIINKKNVRNWQARVAHVPQDIYLFDNTIARNIAFGLSQNDIDYNRLSEVSRLARIDSLIDSYELGFETIVGENGIKLSGGQKQRLGIARALYKNADVLVFDEATSALDNETEKSVVDSLENLNSKLTVIIIAHRLTSLKNCDLIIKVENKKINFSAYEEILELN